MGFEVKICVANALQGSRIQECDPPITVSEFSRLVITAEWTWTDHSTGSTFQRTGHQMEDLPICVGDRTCTGDTT